MLARRFYFCKICANLRLVFHEMKLRKIANLRTLWSSKSLFPLYTYKRWVQLEEPPRETAYSRSVNPMFGKEHCPEVFPDLVARLKTA